MVAVRHRGRPDERPLDVHKDSVKAWAELGYEPVDDEKPAKRQARTTSARKASTTRSGDK